MAKKVRKVKVVSFTLNKRLTNIEKTVNEEIDALKEEGKDIISITSLTCGNAPIYIIYNIIYETDYEEKKRSETA